VVVLRPQAISTKGPAAMPAGFHHVALLSDATATNAPPMPSARLPAVSITCACAACAANMHTNATLVKPHQLAGL